MLRDSGAPEEEIEAIESVTKQGEAEYLDRVRRAAANEIGGVVKGFDMLDNSDPQRLEKLRRKEPTQAHRLEQKYADGLALLDGLRPGWRRAPGG